MKKNITEFVNKGITNNSLRVINASEITRVSVRRGNVGEEIITWGTNKDGQPTIEGINNVRIDPKTNKPTYILTKLDHKGSIMLDENNNPRQWIIEESVFLENFEQNNRNPVIYEHKNPIEQFVKANKSLTVLIHNQPTKIEKGDYINITDPINMYVIKKEEFLASYKQEDLEKNKQYTRKHNYSA